MNQKYEPELREEIIRLYLEEGRTLKSLTEEYHLGKGTLRYWLKHTRKECDEPTGESHVELQRLRKQNAELRKENDFLKKAAAFFAKEVE
jgi:transposase